MFKRPVVPELESFENAEGVLVTAPADSWCKEKDEKYMVTEAAWKDARVLHILILNMYFFIIKLTSFRGAQTDK